MPRAVTRAISTSFATKSHSIGSSGDHPSSKLKSTMDMFPSPRPSKVSHHLSSSERSAPLTSSPLTRNNIISSGPVTPPRAASSKRKRLNDARLPPGNAVSLPEETIATFLNNYELEANRELQQAKRTLETRIVSVRAQMQASILAYPLHIMNMSLEEFFDQSKMPSNRPSSYSKKRSSSQSIPPLHAHKTPRLARAGEVVYSARGSPILMSQIKTTTAAAVSSDEEGDNEPFFDTASDKSSSSESFSLPDEAAYTAQVIEEEKKNRMLSSEGYFPRSSSMSMYHRSSGS